MHGVSGHPLPCHPPRRLADDVGRGLLPRVGHMAALTLRLPRVRLALVIGWARRSPPLGSGEVEPPGSVGQDRTLSLGSGEMARIVVSWPNCIFLSANLLALGVSPILIREAGSVSGISYSHLSRLAPFGDLTFNNVLFNICLY